MTTRTRLFDAADVRRLLTLPECIDAVEQAFALEATGSAVGPEVLGLHVEGGGFHVKAAALQLDRFYFAAKTNANFPGNPSRHGLPTIQGVIVLCDAEDGRPLAILDSMEITTLRTAAATGVAVRHLARPEASIATIVGCGVQGYAQLRALVAELHLTQVRAYDVDAATAQRFASAMTEELGIPVEAVSDPRAAARTSDVCVTCTPSRTPLLGPADVRAGAFVAGVGADNPHKSELDPELFRRATVVVDHRRQCAEIGDLRHALAAGTIRPDGVRAELGEVVAGTKPGRSDPAEVIVFDSTGTALQDVAAAALVYERALEDGLGREIALGTP